MPNPHSWSTVSTEKLIHSLPGPTPVGPPRLTGVQLGTHNPSCFLINGSKTLGPCPVGRSLWVTAGLFLGLQSPRILDVPQAVSVRTLTQHSRAAPSALEATEWL